MMSERNRDDQRSRGVFRRWGFGMIYGLIALVFLGYNLTVGEPVVGIIVAAFFVVVGALISPAIFPRSESLAETRTRADTDGAPIIYWKAGCSYCILLRLALGRAGREAVWCDIWADPAAAAEVRSLNEGNETTPTVVLSDGAFRTNPKAGWVREHLTA